MNLLAILASLLSLIAVGAAGYAIYISLTLLSSPTTTYRYHLYWSSGVHGYKELKFKESYFLKAFPLEHIESSSVGHHKLADSRTGETLLERVVESPLTAEINKMVENWNRKYPDHQA